MKPAEVLEESMRSTQRQPECIPAFRAYRDKLAAVTAHAIKEDIVELQHINWKKPCYHEFKNPKSSEKEKDCSW